MPRSWRAPLLATLLTAFAAGPAFAGHEQWSSEFEVFVATEALAGAGQPHPRSDDAWFNADVIFGLTHDQFRVFGEFYVAPGEHDLQRFQLGYELVPETLLWLGRFQQPASAWNAEHHHGRYLQTAITRPSIEDWEDDEGFLPQHIAGALIESRRQLGSDGLLMSAGIGAAPALSSDRYQPVTLVDNNPGRYGRALAAQIAYLPEYVGTSSAGLLWGRDQLFVRNSVALASLQSNHATLTIYGAYADWSVEQWQFIGAAYYVDVDLDSPIRNESFVSGYVQAERQLAHQLTAFARIEDSSRMQESRYVALFKDHSGDIDITARRLAAGLRWDYARRQALSCEFSHVVSLQQRRAYELRLQWSAAVP
jgi:hypothetical protein